MKYFTCLSKRAALLFILIVAGFSTKASHTVGSHIGYKAIDSVTYEVILTLYRDCGTHSDTARIEIRGKSTGLFTSLAKRVSITDITGAYLNCNFKSKCNGGTTYGFDKIIYKDTVNISGGACEYIFGYSECCRGSGLNCGSSTTHYNFANINKCFGMNTSLQAELEPRFVIAVGQDVRINTFIGRDTVDTLDSIAFKRLIPLESFTKKTNCYGFIGTPLSFLGTPNTGLNSPAGFHFDPLTGQYSFRPTVTNQAGIFYTEAKEYRKVNGRMEVVGVTHLEHLVIVASTPNNKAPTISGRSAIACANQEVCMNFEARDSDKADSTRLQILGVPKNAIITYGFNGKHATAKLCYTPTVKDISHIPKSFIVVAGDNSCAITGRSSRAFSITVRLSPDTSVFEVASKTVQCSSAEIKLNIKNTAAPGLSFSFIDKDSISFSQLFQPRLYFKGSGWKKFYITARTSTPCIYIHTDSVFITPQYSVQLNTKNDSIVCPNSTVTFYTNPLSGTAPYSYRWNGVNTTPSFSINMGIDNITYNILVIDSNNCVGIDTVKIDAYELPKIGVAQKLIEVCPNTSVQLSASYISGPAITQFHWLGIDTFATVNTQATIRKRYIVTATDINGCEASNFSDIIPFPIGVNGGTYSACINTAVQLVANSTAGIPPLNYIWVGSTIKNNSTIVNIGANDTSFVVRIQDSLGCVAYDTAKVKTKGHITYQLPINPSVCLGLPINLQISNIQGKSPYQFEWDGLTSTDSSKTFNLQQSKGITISIIDSNNCKISDKISVIVSTNPEPRLGNNATLCKGTIKKIGAFVVGGTRPFNYLWSNGSTTDSLIIPINKPTQIVLKITDANGCIGADTVQYEVSPTQTAILTPLVNPFCEEAPPVALKSIPNTGVWTGAGVNGKIFSPSNAGAGIHPLTFSFTSIYNCPEQGVIYAVVKQQPIPNFEADKTKGVPNTLFTFTNKTIADTR